MQLENLFPTGRYGTDGRSFSYLSPTSGYFETLATSDGLGNWTLTAAGSALAQTADAGGAVISVGAGTASGSGVVATEFGGPVARRTILAVTALPQTIVNGASEFTNTLVYTFPECRVLVLGCTASMMPTTTTTIATSIASGETGAYALGTAAASSSTLTGAMVDLLPSTATTHSATINVPPVSGPFKAALAASAQFDGTTTPVPVYLNTAVATGSINGGLSWTGTITISWVNLGDY